jgi:hypothetical protein
MITDDNNPVIKQRELEAEIERLKSTNANLAAENHEWQTLAGLGGLERMKLPPEVEAMVRDKIEAGLPELMAIQCAIKQHDHDRKLATAAEKDAAIQATLAESTAEAEKQREKERAVLQEITREVLNRSKAKTPAAA